MIHERTHAGMARACFILLFLFIGADICEANPQNRFTYAFTAGTSQLTVTVNYVQENFAALDAELYRPRMAELWTQWQNSQLHLVDIQLGQASILAQKYLTQSTRVTPENAEWSEIRAVIMSDSNTIRMAPGEVLVLTFNILQPAQWVLKWRADRTVLAPQEAQDYLNLVEGLYSPLSAPTLTTGEATLINPDSITAAGSITATGGCNATVRGFCWSQSADPTTADVKTAESGDFSAGPFGGPVSMLQPATTYHMRSYATNCVGTAYGNDVTFTTTEAPLPSLALGSAGDDAGRTVTIPVTLTNVPASLIAGLQLDIGYDAGVFSAPLASIGPAAEDAGKTLSQSYPSVGALRIILIGFNTTSIGNGVVAYIDFPIQTAAQGGVYPITISNYTGATPDALTVTLQGTGGAITVIQQTPTVTTQAPESITSHSAAGRGTLLAAGADSPTVRGFCWGSAALPSLADSCTSEHGSFSAGPFTGSIAGLLPGRLYHLRAYAANSAGTAYGEDVPFSTLAVSRGDLNNNGIIDLQDAILAMQILAGGGPVLPLHVGADVDGDGRIGVGELIYCLQAAAGMR